MISLATGLRSDRASTQNAARETPARDTSDANEATETVGLDFRRKKIQIDALDCADTHCKSMNVAYAAQRWDDNKPCHETWKGKAHRGK